MNKKTAMPRVRSGNIEEVARHNVQQGFAMVESFLPSGSSQRAIAGIGLAAGGALLAAAVFGAGTAALAGAAGYLAYRGMRGERKHGRVGLAPHKHE